MTTSELRNLSVTDVVRDGRGRGQGRRTLVRPAGRYGIVAHARSLDALGNANVTGAGERRLDEVRLAHLIVMAG